MIAVLATAAITRSFPHVPPPQSENGSQLAGAAAVVGSTFRYVFNSPGTLNEAGSMNDSTSPYWWLNSGGELVLQSGLGETMQGTASLLNKWRLAYALTNPLDTDGGAHPQNLFRLVSRSTWNNYVESAQFYIVKDNFSSSPNRNQSNGLLLFNRYTGDGQTLYYAGLRVDGTAVIKKKINGIYYTMAQKQIFPGTYAINAATSTQSEDLLPDGEWIGIKDQVVTNANGSVTITLWMQLPGGAWQQLLQTTDAGGTNVGGTPPITGAHYIGIRTDFMDVQFKNFSAQAL